MQQNVYRYYYYYGPLSVWRDGRDGLLRALTITTITVRSPLGGTVAMDSCVR
jgi:hypothetical protein